MKHTVDNETRKTNHLNVNVSTITIIYLLRYHIHTSFNSFTSPFLESVKNPLAGAGTLAAVLELSTMVNKLRIEKLF